MTKRFGNKPRVHFALGLAVGLSAGIGALIGAIVAIGSVGHTRFMLPETALHASATHSSDTMAVATGLIDEDVEGFYTLDFVTGQLQCAVLNYQTGKFNALFAADVLRDLGIDATRKSPKYLLVTGLANFERRGSPASWAMSVAYVVDANTGKFAAYGLRWHRGFARAGRMQQGPLLLLDVGNIRTAVVRE